MTQPDEVEAVAAALRADVSDLGTYFRVLSHALLDTLPAEMVTVERVRSVADRLSGREGTLKQLRVQLGDVELSLAPGAGGVPAASVRQTVRGVVIASRDVTLDEWVRMLAQALSEQARRSTQAREALGRLLGQH